MGGLGWGQWGGDQAGELGEGWLVLGEITGIAEGRGGTWEVM